MTQEEIEEAFEFAVRALLNPHAPLESPRSPEGTSQMIGFLVGLCRGVAGELALERGAEAAGGEATDKVLQTAIDMMSVYLQAQFAAQNVEGHEQP